MRTRELSAPPAGRAVRGLAVCAVLWLCRGGGVPARASNPPADIDACSRVNCAIEIDAGCNDCCPANGPGVPTGVKTCPGSGCGAAEFDGQAEFALASVFVRIVCGTAPHEDVYPGCLPLHHSQPSALLFSPQGLEYHHLLVNRIISVETAGLPPGVAREVVLYNPQPENLTFRFGTGESVGLPAGEQSASAARMRMLDADGDPTTGSPVWYELYSRGRPRAVRFSAGTLEPVRFTGDTGRVLTQADDLGVEIIRDGDDVLRQVRSVNSLADIVVPAGGETGSGTIWKYEIRLYEDSDVGAQDAGTGIYPLSPGASPYVTFTVENRCADKDNDFDELRVTRTVGGSSYVHDYVYTSGSDRWDLSSGSGARTERLTRTWDAQHTYRDEVREIRNSQSQVVYRESVRKFDFDWGLTEVRTVLDPDSSALTDTTYYYNDDGGTYGFSTASAYKHGKVRAVSRADGGWSLYDYDSAGRVTIEVHPWKNLSFSTVRNSTPLTAAASGRSIHYSYSAVDGSDTPLTDDARPRTVTEKVGGTVVGRTFYAYREDGSGRAVKVEERCASGSAGYGASGNMRTTTTWYAPTASAAAAGRVCTVQFPDSRLDTYSYSYGTYTADATPSLCSFSAGAGDALASTVVHGTVSSAAGVADISTREVHVLDGQGNAVLDEVHVYTGTGYERI